MVAMMIAAALLQAPAAPDPCNAAGQVARAGCPAWRFIRSSEDGQGRGHVDPASARRDGNRVQVMTRTLLESPMEGRVYSFNTLVELDCPARTARAMHFAAFDAQGAIVLESGPADQSLPAGTNSAFADMIRDFCPRR